MSKASERQPRGPSEVRSPNGAPRHGMAVKPANVRFRTSEPVASCLSVDQAEQWRDAANYVNRLLMGTRLEELPIQQPSRYVMSINLATAKVLGITIPREVLVGATEVIE